MAANMTLHIENLYTGERTQTTSTTTYGEYVRRVKAAHAAGLLNYARKDTLRNTKTADLHEGGERFALTLTPALEECNDEQPSEESLYTE